MQISVRDRDTRNPALFPQHIFHNSLKLAFLKSLPDRQVNATNCFVWKMHRGRTVYTLEPQGKITEPLQKS